CAVANRKDLGLWGDTRCTGCTVRAVSMCGNEPCHRRPMSICVVATVTGSARVGVNARQYVSGKVRMTPIDPGVDDGNCDAFALAVLMRLVHLQEGQVPLTISDLI